ncbi:hypothetical protein [Mycobacterium sp. 236(2023)]|uniref:imine reductase family protein n=1 Tax=Mycobacterium sp. 236(2023) TaxID=3038163 RepID=UPI0024155493|nr:hypothetical protein [Mycobacterium sp. 236(2023)]MDG4668293.1 hypothetical protein [Mycobacterium sp. 236(2023)]
MEADRHDEVAASLTHLIATSESGGVDAGALKAMKRYADAAVVAGHGGDEISRLGVAMREWRSRVGCGPRRGASSQEV